MQWTIIKFNKENLAAAGKVGNFKQPQGLSLNSILNFKMRDSYIMSRCMWTALHFILVCVLTIGDGESGS